MIQYKGAKKRVRVDSELSEEFEVKVVMHREYVLSCFIDTVVADVVTGLVRKGELSDILYADDLILMGETIRVSEISSENGSYWDQENGSYWEQELES